MIAPAATHQQRIRLLTRMSTSARHARTNRAHAEGGPTAKRNARPVLRSSAVLQRGPQPLCALAFLRPRVAGAAVRRQTLRLPRKRAPGRCRRARPVAARRVLPGQASAPSALYFASPARGSRDDNRAQARCWPRAPHRAGAGAAQENERLRGTARRARRAIGGNAIPAEVLYSGRDPFTQKSL